MPMSRAAQREIAETVEKFLMRMTDHLYVVRDTVSPIELALLNVLIDVATRVRDVLKKEGALC